MNNQSMATEIKMQILISTVSVGVKYYFLCYLFFFFFSFFLFLCVVVRERERGGGAMLRRIQQYNMKDEYYKNAQIYIVQRPKGNKTHNQIFFYIHSPKAQRKKDLLQEKWEMKLMFLLKESNKLLRNVFSIYPCVGKTP